MRKTRSHDTVFATLLDWHCAFLLGFPFPVATDCHILPLLPTTVPFYNQLLLEILCGHITYGSMSLINIRKVKYLQNAKLANIDEK